MEEKSLLSRSIDIAKKKSVLKFALIYGGVFGATTLLAGILPLLGIVAYVGLIVFLIMFSMKYLILSLTESLAMKGINFSDEDVKNKITGAPALFGWGIILALPVFIVALIVMGVAITFILFNFLVTILLTLAVIVGAYLYTWLFMYPFLFRKTIKNSNLVDDFKEHYSKKYILPNLVGMVIAGVIYGILMFVASAPAGGMESLAAMQKAGTTPIICTILLTISQLIFYTASIIINVISSSYAFLSWLDNTDIQNVSVAYGLTEMPPEKDIATQQVEALDDTIAILMEKTGKVVDKDEVSKILADRVSADKEIKEKAYNTPLIKDATEVNSAVESKSEIEDALKQTGEFPPTENTPSPAPEFNSQFKEETPANPPTIKINLKK